mgnify:CR=1 FL=1
MSEDYYIIQKIQSNKKCKEICDEINIFNSSKLDSYNNLVSIMQGDKGMSDNKDILEKIKMYLDDAKLKELNKKLQEIKKDQDNYINFIIADLP